jgi:hypothetical protein
MIGMLVDAKRDFNKWGCVIVVRSTMSTSRPSTCSNSLCKSVMSIIENVEFGSISTRKSVFDLCTYFFLAKCLGQQKPNQTEFLRTPKQFYGLGEACKRITHAKEDFTNKTLLSNLAKLFLTIQLGRQKGEHMLGTL